MAISVRKAASGEELEMDLLWQNRNFFWSGGGYRMKTFSSFSQLYFCSQIQLGERAHTFSLEFMSSYFIINVANRGV